MQPRPCKVNSETHNTETKNFSVFFISKRFGSVDPE